MATKSFNKVKGLVTFTNYLNENAGDELSVARNVVIDRDNIVEPRRGIKVFSTLPDFAKQLLTYKDRVLAHYDNHLSFLDLNGNSTAFKGVQNFEVSSPSTTINIIDHKLRVGDTVFFTKKRDYSSPGTVYFPLPSGIDDVSQYFVYSVTDKDHFEITLSNTPIVVGAGQATIVFDFIVDEVKAGLRIKGIELNSNFYITAADGVKKLSRLNPYAISKAGTVQALNPELALNFTGSGGFLSPQIPSPTNVEVSYRIVWGTRDFNNNLLLGKPSENTTIQNYTGISASVDVTFAVPQDITIDYFYQIYRTNVFGIGGSGDEHRLVIESNYDGYSAVITVNDNTPEAIRDTGTPLYSNENSGEGIFQVNSVPPVCQDMAIYKNRAWYANTKTKQQFDLTFLGFDGLSPALLPADVVSVTGSNPATIVFVAPHDIVNGNYIALANTLGIDGQYLATVTSPTTIQIQANSASFGTDYAIYRSYITIAKGSQVNRYFFVGRPEITELIAQPFAAVVSSEYFNLTSIDDKIKYYFWFAKTSADVDPIVSGRIGIKIDLYTTPVVTDDEVAARIKEVVQSTGDFFVFATGTPGELQISTITSGSVTDPVSATQVGTSLVSIMKTQDGFGENASLGFVRLSSNASPAAAIEDTAKSLVKVINFTPSSPVYAYYLASENSLPGQMFFEEKNFSDTPFTITANSVAFGQVFNPVLGSATSSTNNIGNNVIMFSKEQQPEAVPVVNSLRIGSQDKAIQRILALRDSLFILKEEGIYRLTGENESNFTVALFDNSSIMIAPDSAVILNNQIYCLTTQGVATISETGVGIISRPIEDQFNIIASEDYQNTPTVAFGVGYEADRAYLLFVPEETTDGTAIRAYRFNTFTQSWTVIEKTATCGVINKNKMHLGSSDIEAVEIERKKTNSSDYVDREYARSFSTYSNGRVYLDDVGLMKIGDALTQRQYVSVDDYNSLIERLKLDPQLLFNQNFEELITSPGSEFTITMPKLVTELNAKDITRYVGTFNLATDLNDTTDIITIPNHQFLNNETVIYNTVGTSPGGITNGDKVLIVNKTTNTFKLQQIEASLLVIGSAYGVGVFSSGSTDLSFNLVRDIDYSTSEVVFPAHGLIEGQAITFTTSGTPPTGLTNGVEYIASEVTDNRFKVKPSFINFTPNAQSGTATLTKIYYYSGTNDNKKLQTELNRIINALNNSNSAYYADFELLSGFDDLTVLITSVEVSQNYITVDLTVAFSIGDMTHYSSIDSEATWVYISLGDPGMLKHVRTGTLMVENNSLNKLQLGYASDLSGDYEFTPFTLDGNGLYGKGQFGNTAFGGNGTAYPLRTVIPRQKQRCRYISVSVTHNSAFFKYSLLGISLDYEVTSERGYRR